MAETDCALYPSAWNWDSEHGNGTIREAVRHHAAISSELGGRFYDEVEELLNEACQHPQRYRMYEPPVRRVLGRVFPYGVLYVAQPDRIWNVAIMHLKRRPGYWKRRLEE